MQLKHIASNSEIVLSNDLMWVDELDWTPVAMAVTRMVEGSLLVETSEKKKGRPITLMPPSDDMAWTDYATVKTLHTWAADEAARLLFTHRDGRTFNVIMRHSGDASAVDAVPLKGFAACDNAEPFRLTLRLMEI